jgi:hypothetical protein
MNLREKLRIVLRHIQRTVQPRQPRTCAHRAAAMGVPPLVEPPPMTSMKTCPPFVRKLALVPG